MLNAVQRLTSAGFDFAWPNCGKHNSSRQISSHSLMLWIGLEDFSFNTSLYCVSELKLELSLLGDCHIWGKYALDL